VVIPDLGSSYSRNALVIKTDSLGNIQWQKNLVGLLMMVAAVNVAKDGNLFVMLTYAYSQQIGTEPSFSKLNMIKMDISGNVIWIKD